MPWFDGIDPASQTFLIAASQNARVRVLAGPGTGKSFAMKRRVARLLEVGVAPTDILPVTFTRVAAEDLHRELVGMGAPGCEMLEGVTLHSLSLRFLVRAHILQATGRVPRPLNDFELKPLERDLGAFGGVREVRKKLRAYESAWARLQDQQPGQPFQPEDIQFANALRSWLIFHRAMLIGEVIPLFEEYLRLNPASPERTEFTHILVDEFQDLNRAEQSVVEMLSGAAHVCIVGDDDQSIYSFKHAHPEGIQNWTLANDDCADLHLTECRRCPTRVVAMANSLIARNVLRPVDRQLAPLPENGPGNVETVQFQTLENEVVGVVTRIAALVDGGVPPGQILVLAQRRVVGTPIYESLVEAGIPAKSYYAESELEQLEAQEPFSLLKLMADQDDRVALRWLLGLGSANWRSPAYLRVRNHSEQTGLTPWQVMQALSSGEIHLPHTHQLVARFGEVKAQIQEHADLLNQGGLVALLDATFPEGEAFCRDLRQLANEIVEESPDMELPAFLAALNNRITKPEVPSEIQDVRVMSLHKSKGLSAPVTIIAGCVEGLLPIQPDAELTPQEILRSIEEQRRLFFVGITRVKASPNEGVPGILILTYSQSMPMADAYGAGLSPVSVQFGRAYFNASRFLGELGPAAPAPVFG